MKFYEIGPDDEGFPNDYIIDAAHKWGLPGIKCSICGFTGAVVGIAYPELTIPVGVDPRPYESPWPVEPERIRELALPLEAQVPDLTTVAGMQFGPLCGTASGIFGDFAWVNPWTPLISPSALFKLREKGLTSLLAVSTDVKLHSKTGRFGHLELCVHPLVHAYEEHPQRECSNCGMPLDSEPETIEPYRPKLIPETWPKEIDIARIVEYPGYVVISERLHTAIQELCLTDIKGSEI